MTIVEEDLWFDEGADEQAEAKAAQSMAALVGRILGAKPLPIAARRLADLTKSPNARIEQTVRVLESDPALSARLLRLVNSAGYALRVRCGSVHHAAALVGTRRIHQVATTAAVLDLFDASSETAVRLLEHAAIVGALCRYLAVHLGLPRDEMFTCGFLHDIGKLMMLDTEGEAYASILDQNIGLVDVHHVYEREKYGFDHAVLGAHVLSAWNIPDPIPRVVAWHHSPSRAYEAGGMTGAMVAAVRLADSLSHALLEEDTERAIVRLSKADSAAYLDVSEAQLAAMWDELQTLREQSGARSRGVDVPEASLMPRHEIRRSGPKGLASHAVQAPMHFPCVVCQKPSYGNVCPCCQGYVCPNHQSTRDEWCTTCSRAFGRSLSKSRLGLGSKTGIFAGAAALAASAAAGAAVTAEPDAWANILVAPSLALLLGSTFFVVGRKWYLRSEFVKSRRRQRAHVGEVPVTGSVSLQPEPNEAPLSAPSIPIASLPANALSIGPELSVAMVAAGPSIRALETPSIPAAPLISFHQGDAAQTPASLPTTAEPAASVAPEPSVAPNPSMMAVAVAPTILSAPPLTERPESFRVVPQPSRNEGGPVQRERCYIAAPVRSCSFDAPNIDRVNTRSSDSVSEVPPPRFAEHPPKATDNADQELDVLPSTVSTAPERPSTVEATPVATESFVPSQAPVAVMKSLRAFATPSRPPSERVSGAVLSLPPEPPSDQDPLWRLREEGRAPRSLRQASRRRWG